jgi:ABC-2 type transport system permease protein
MSTSDSKDSVVKSIKKGAYNWSFFFVLFAGIILINIIGWFVYYQYDATADKRYSLSQGTIKYLSEEKNFPDRINLQIYLEGELPAEVKRFQSALISKLKEFKKFAGNRLEYELIDPNTGSKDEQNSLFRQLFAEGKGILPLSLTYQKDASKNQLLLWPGAMISYNGSIVDQVQFLPGTSTKQSYTLDQNFENQVQNSINSLEYMLVSAIKRSTQVDKPRIAFIQGHGELNFGQSQRARTLIAPYFSLEDVTIENKIDALKGFNGVVIAGPKTAFSDKEKYVLDQFLMDGGRIMFFLDQLTLNEDTLQRIGTTHTQRTEIGLDKMLFDYGIKINDNLAIDAKCAPISAPGLSQTAMPWYYFVRASSAIHPITRNLDPVILRYVNTLEFVGNDNRKKSPILTTSTNATASGLAPLISLGMPQSLGQNPVFADNPEEETNKIMVSALVEGYFESHFTNRINDEFTSNSAVKFLSKSKKEGKVLVVANGDFLYNRSDSIRNSTTKQLEPIPKRFNELKNDITLYNAKISQQLVYGNQEFFQNMVDYMLGDNSILDVRSKQIDIHPIDKVKISEDGGFWKLTNLVLPSILVILFGIIFNYLNRRKYTKI